VTEAASASLMRRLNRSAILNLIRTQSPIARTQIARRLGMSLPTVMRAVDELVDEDLIRFHGSEPSGGRRRPLLEFNGSAYAVIGVDLGGPQIIGTVTDLTGTVQHEIVTDRPAAGDPDGALQDLYHLIEALLDAPRAPGQRIRGIGVGAPGVTRGDTGTVMWAPSLGWRDLPLKDLLTERFKLPLFVENDMNLAVLGEFAFGESAGAQNLVYVAIRTGLGAGIMLDGRLYRGHNQAAGEVGYFLPAVEYLGRPYDEYGPLEYLVSGNGIAARARQLLQEAGAADEPPDLTAETIFNLARQGIGWAQTVTAETVRYLSLVIGDICALLDPEAIIMGGAGAHTADLLVEPIRCYLEHVVPYVPRLAASSLGHRAGVMGALMLVLDATTDHVVIDRRV
jgi:predicted NBD/HSP70 family sugar kinase